MKELIKTATIMKISTEILEAISLKQSGLTPEGYKLQMEKNAARAKEVRRIVAGLEERLTEEEWDALAEFFHDI